MFIEGNHHTNDKKKYSKCAIVQDLFFNLIMPHVVAISLQYDLKDLLRNEPAPLSTPLFEDNGNMGETKTSNYTVSKDITETKYDHHIAFLLSYRCPQRLSSYMTQQFCGAFIGHQVVLLKTLLIATGVIFNILFYFS